MRDNTTHRSGRPLILCVEDERELRRDIVDELSEAGYAVIEAGDGEQALEMLETTRPDLILCDIAMPGISGYDVLEAERAKGSEHADIPFVFLSAYADARHVVEGKQLGADDYLVKPIDYDLLLSTVQARLRQIARIRCAQSEALREISAESLITTFDLTPAEAQVAKALAQGSTLQQIASEFEVSRTTVAYHVRNIFSKTGTNRQAELVVTILRSV